MHDRIEMLRYVIRIFELNYYKKIDQIYEDEPEEMESISLPEKIVDIDSEKEINNILMQKERNSQMPLESKIDIDQMIESNKDFKKGNINKK